MLDSCPIIKDDTNTKETGPCGKNRVINELNISILSTVMEYRGIFTLTVFTKHSMLDV